MKCWTFGFILLLCACQDKNLKHQSDLLNCDSLLDNNIAYLTKTTASLKKATRIDESLSTIHVKSINVNWVNELELFRVLSVINKPIHSNAYEATTYPDEKSNLLVKSWSTQKDIPVRSVSIFYLGNPTQIKRLEATLDQSNFVFRSTKKLVLSFNLLSDRPTIEGYEISGSQKFFWEQPHYYLLEGSIDPK